MRTRNVRIVQKSGGKNGTTIEVVRHGVQGEPCVAVWEVTTVDRFGLVTARSQSFKTAWKRAIAGEREGWKL